MSSRLNLNDNTDTVFQFTIGGLDYDLAYPTLEDIKPIREKFKELKKVEHNAKLTEDEKEAQTEKLSDETQELIYKMIVPVGHDTPIQETLDKQPFPVVRAFNKMMNEQLSAE